MERTSSSRKRPSYFARPGEEGLRGRARRGSVDNRLHILSFIGTFVTKTLQSLKPADIANYVTIYILRVLHFHSLHVKHHITPAAKPKLSRSKQISAVSKAKLNETEPMYPQLPLDFEPRGLSLAGSALVFAVAYFTSELYFLRCFALSPIDLFTRILNCSFPEGAGGAVAVAVAVALGRSVGLEPQFPHLTPQQAADADSRFLDVCGTRLHFKQSTLPQDRDGGGRVGPGPGQVRWAAALWHGFGANGTSWEYRTLQPLAHILGPGCIVAAHDSPGFGLTQRGRNLRDYQCKHNSLLGATLLERLIDREAPADPARDLRSDEHPANPTSPEAMLSPMQRGHLTAGVERWDCAGAAPAPAEDKWQRLYVGHSMGGLCALRAALRNRRPAALVLAAPAILPEELCGASAQALAAPSPRSPARGPAFASRVLSERARFRAVLVGRMGREVARCAVQCCALAGLAAAYPALLALLRCLVRKQAFWRLGLSAFHYDPALTCHDHLVDGYRRPSVVRDWDIGVMRYFRVQLLGASVLRDTWRRLKIIWAAMWQTTGGDGAGCGGEESAGRGGRGGDDDDGGIRGVSFAEGLRTSGIPTLIVHGQHDNLVPLENSRRLAELCPNVELVELPCCGHVPMEERPEEFLDAVEKFIARIEKSLEIDTEKPTIDI